jgi:hypothetical protein
MINKIYLTLSRELNSIGRTLYKQCQIRTNIQQLFEMHLFNTF